MRIRKILSKVSVVREGEGSAEKEDDRDSDYILFIGEGEGRGKNRWIFCTHPLNTQQCFKERDAEKY